MLNSARLTDEMCGTADGIRHGAAAVRRNTVSAAYLRCCSSERQNTAQHGGCAEAKSRSCASHLQRCVKDRAFPQKRDIRHAGHPRKSAQTAGFCCRKAHLGYLSDNYTSEKGCLSIPQTQNIPVRGFRGGRFSSPTHGRGGGGTPVSGVRTETNVNAQRRTCRTEVWKKCMHQTHPAARKSAFRIINTAHGA